MEENLQPEINSGNQFTKVTPLSKYLAMILFIAMPFVGGYIGYTYAPVKIVEIEKSPINELQVSEREINNIEDNETTLAITRNSPDTRVTKSIIAINSKYGYGPGPKYIGTTDTVLWFTKPHETEGCPRLKYMELESENEVETNLSGCPLIELSISYPFHVVMCPDKTDSEGESLCVTNLLTKEEKQIQITKDSTETAVKECYETDFDPACRFDIHGWGGGLLARIYKAIPREPYAIYENTEFVREVEVNLFDEFNLKKF